MDFNRSAQPQTVAPSAHPAPVAAAASSKKPSTDNGKWNRIAAVVLGGAVTLVLIALVVFLVFGAKGSGEDNYVDSSKLQAVFLNTGQVYFGHITKLNSSYFVLNDIYYLQTSSTGSSANASTSVSLVKLGCELHEPYDQMVINRSQVTFWENLQDNGQVAKAVATFQKDNPNGQKCTDQSSSSSTNSSSSVQNAPASTTPTKP